MMNSILDNAAFRADYDKLADVSLNPTRHSARDAREHCELVRRRAKDLAELNGCDEAQKVILDNLSLVHDIGKIEGTASPAKSVELLPRYGEFDDAFIALVKYHDTNLPWYQASQKGEPPSDKAWNRLARRTDLRLLCLFMVADRVDCPGGWIANEPLVWFLDECEKRRLLAPDFQVDDGPAVVLPTSPVTEHSAGAVLVAPTGDEYQALLIRVRSSGFEIPKGHVEAGESPSAAALRELQEETGISSPLSIREPVGRIGYSFDKDALRIQKEVTYFLAVPCAEGDLDFGALPKRTREVRWITESDIADTQLVNDELADILRRAFEAMREKRSNKLDAGDA